MRQTKILYYFTNITRLLIPRCLLRKNKIWSNIQQYENDYLQQRVDYYCKLSARASLSENAVAIKNFKRIHPSAYYYDSQRYLHYCNKHLKFDYIFGDVIHIPSTPSIVKSRPVSGNNSNAVILNLDKHRHFIFVNDKLPFEDKKNQLIWRGNILENQRSRQIFLEKHFDNPRCNAGHVNDWSNNAGKTERCSIKEHLKYKFILSIEGNDVATNLKWIMSSNSLCMMTKPQYETWFMEGTLIPDFHYVLLKDDYSDLNDKMDYYLQHPDKAKEIIKNANEYVHLFKDKKCEKIISLMVLEKYFKFTNNIKTNPLGIQQTTRTR